MACPRAATPASSAPSNAAKLPPRSSAFARPSSIEAQSPPAPLDPRGLRSGLLPGQGAQEASRLDPVGLERCLHSGLRRLDFDEALEPAERQRDLALDGDLGAALDLHLAAANREHDPFVVGHVRQRAAHRRSHVHVRRAGADVLGVQRARQQVQARIHAAAGGEALEAHAVLPAGHDRVGQAEDSLQHARRDEEPRARDLPHREQ